MIPPLDLPALRPFVESMLNHNRRRIRRDGDTIGFKTPDAWLTEPAVRTSYEGLHFDRSAKGSDVASRVLGVGHKVVDHAMIQALGVDASIAALPSSILPHPVITMCIEDRVTADKSPTRRVIVAVVVGGGEDGTDRLLRDWELIGLLNQALSCGIPQLDGTRSSPHDTDGVASAVERALKLIESSIAELALTFRLPSVATLSVLWPGE